MVHRVLGKDDTIASSSATRLPRARPRKRENNTVTKTAASGSNRGSKNALAVEKDENGGDGSEDSGWTTKSRGRSVKGCVQVLLEESSVKSVPSVVVEKVVQKISPNGEDNDDDVDDSVESSEDESESSDEEDSDGDTDDNVSISNLMRKQKCDLDKCASGGVAKDLHIRCSLPLHRLSDGVVETLTNGGKGAKCLEETASGGNRFLCLYCDRSFATREIRTKHADRLHRSAAGRRASARNVMNATPTDFAGCSFCNNAKTFSGFATDLVRLFHHMIEKHNDRYFGCRECSIRFSTSEAFQKHRESVHNILPPGVRKTPTLGDIDFEDSILASSISKLTTQKAAVAKGENGGHQGRKMMTRLSKLNKKHQLLRNEEPMLSRLGVAQNRSPRTRKGSKGRPQVESRGTSETGSSASGRVSRSKSGRTATTSSGVTGANESGDFSGSTSAKSSSSKETLSSTYDDDFYETVSVNVRKNLSCYLDGKMGSDPEAPSVHTRFTDAVPTVPSTVVRSSYMTDNEIHEATSLSAITAFPTLLTAEQYGTECVSPNKNKRTITKNSWKWKWDFVKKYKYVNEGGKIVKKVKQQTSGLRDLSNLDMWTQLTMRTKHEVVQKSGADKLSDRPVMIGDAAREEKRKTIEQLNTILDTRLLPQIVLEQNDQRLIKAEPVECIEDPVEPTISPSTSMDGERMTKDEDNFAAILNLQRSSGERLQRSHEVVLSGEWARPRCYVCFGCGAKFETIKSLEEHKATRHPHVYSTHYEIVGRELIEGELYKHFFIPTKALRRKTEFMRQVSSDDSGTVEDSMDSTTSCTISTKCDSFDTDTSSRMSNKSTEVTVCTKCKKECTGMMDLYRHMLDCVGDYAWLIAKRRLRHRYYGNRSRRRRANAKLLRFGCLRSPKPPKTPENRAITTPRKQSPQTPRTRPSDADSIQRMLANLPAKRSSRSVHPAKPIPMRRRKLIATATANKFTKRNTRTSILAAKTSGLLLRSKNKSEGSKPISKHRQQPERVTRSGNAPASVRKIVKPKRVTRSCESPNIDQTQSEGVTTRNKMKHLTAPVKKTSNRMLNKLSKNFTKPLAKTSTPVKEVKSSKECSTSPVLKRNPKDVESQENGQKNDKTKKVKTPQKVDNAKKSLPSCEIEKPFLEETKTSDQDDLVEIREIMDSIIDRASAAIEAEKNEKESTPNLLTITPPISIETKALDTPISQKAEENPSLVSPTSATPGKRRVRKLTDCIARLTDKLQEKLGIPFLNNSSTSVLATSGAETETTSENNKTELPVVEKMTISAEKESEAVGKDLIPVKDIKTPKEDLTTSEKLIQPKGVQSVTKVKDVSESNNESNIVPKAVISTPIIPEVIVQPPAHVSVPPSQEFIDTPLNLTVRKTLQDADNSHPLCLVKHPQILKIPVVAGHMGGRHHPNEVDCNVVIDLSAKSARTHSPGTSRSAEMLNHPRQMDILPQTQSTELLRNSRGVAMSHNTEISLQQRSSEILNQPRCSDVLVGHCRSTEILKQPRPELIVKRPSPIIQIPQVPVKSAKPKQTRKPRARAPKVTKTTKENSPAEIKSSVSSEKLMGDGKSDNNNVESVSQVISPPEKDKESLAVQSVVMKKDKDLNTAPERAIKPSTTENKFPVGEEEELTQKTRENVEKVANKEVVHVEISNDKREQISNNTKQSSCKKEQSLNVEKNVSQNLTENISESTPLSESIDIEAQKQQQVKGKKSQKINKTQNAVTAKKRQPKTKNIDFDEAEKVSKSTQKVQPTIAKGKNKGKTEKSKVLDEITQKTETSEKTLKTKLKGKALKPKGAPKEPALNTTGVKSNRKGKLEIVDTVTEDTVVSMAAEESKIKGGLEIVLEDVLKESSISKKVQKPKKKGEIEVSTEIVAEDETLTDKVKIINTTTPEVIIEDIIKSSKMAEKTPISKRKGKPSKATNEIVELASKEISTKIEQSENNENIPTKTTPKKTQKAKRNAKSANTSESLSKECVPIHESDNLENSEQTELTEAAPINSSASNKEQKYKGKMLGESADSKAMDKSKKKGKSELKSMKPEEKQESKKKGKQDKPKPIDKIINEESQNIKKKELEKSELAEEISEGTDKPEAMELIKKPAKGAPRKNMKGKKKVQQIELETTKPAQADAQLESEDLPGKADVTEKSVTETLEKTKANQKPKKKAKIEKSVTGKKAEIIEPEIIKVLEKPKELEVVEEVTESKEQVAPEEKSKAIQKPRKKRKNELAAIIADQLLESFKEVDKSRIDELKILHDLSCEANSNGDELLVSNAIEMVTTTKRKVTNKSTAIDSVSSVPTKKKALKDIAPEITTPKVGEKEIASQFQTPAMDIDGKSSVDVPVKPKKSSQPRVSESAKIKAISKEKKDSVTSNLLRKLEDGGEESSEGDSSRLSSTTSKSSSSRQKTESSIGKKKLPPKATVDKEITPQSEIDREREKVSVEEVNNSVADSLSLLATTDMNVQKSVESQRVDSGKVVKPVDWVSRVASLPKNPPEISIKVPPSSTAKPKFILKPSRLQALKPSVPDLFNKLKDGQDVSPAIDPQVSVQSETEKKNGEHSETVAKLVDKIRESANQSDSDDDTCLAEIAKSLNNRILTTDEFTNVADTLPVTETPSDSPNVLIPPTPQKRLSEETNTETLDIDMEDGMSVFTTASMDSGITAGGTKSGSQKTSGVKKRKMRRSVLYKSKKPKVIKTTTEGEPVTFFCDICKKHFSRQDRLTKHKMTITHIAKLSEQEFLDAQKNRMAEEKENASQNVENVVKTPVAEEKKDAEVIEKPVEAEETKIHLRSPIQAGIEPISSPEQLQAPPSMERYPSPVRSLNPGTPRLNLSQEEKLFYECCNMLKGSNRIGAQSENKSLTPKSNEQPTNCFGGSHSAVYCVKSPMSHRRSSPKHAYPKIDINQFSDISSDSNPMFSRPAKFAQSKGIFEDTGSVSNQLSGFLATAEKFLNGAASTSNSLYYNDKLIDSTPPISGTNPKEPSLTGRSYSDSFSDMGDSFPSSQDASESENYAQTILDRPGSNKILESDSAVLKDGSDSFDQGRKVYDDKHLSERSTGSPINSRASSQCSSISKVRTKGAMKGYDNFKVSIPTNGLDLQQALVRNPHVNSKLAALADIALSTDIPVITKDTNIPASQEEPLKPSEYSISPEESSEIEATTETPSKGVKAKKTKEDVGNKLGFKSKKKTPNKDNKDKADTEKETNDKALVKNPLDVYEFEESKDSVDTPILPLSKRLFLRPNLDLEPAKNSESEQKKTAAAEAESKDNKKPELEDNASQMSSTSFSDRDDFNYNSNLSDDSDSETPTASPKLPTTPISVKKTKKLPDPVQKKSLIMGRIFKKAQKNRPPNDNKTSSVESEQPKRPFLQKQELDKLFDSLKGEGNSEERTESTADPQNSSFEPDSELNTEGKGRQKKCSSSAEARRSSANRKSRELAMFEAEWGMSLEQIEEIIGIGKRKSQRKCAVGKQKILAETWSSDEYEEFQSTKDIIALIQEKELKSSQRALRNQRRRESQKNQPQQSHEDPTEDQNEELGAETWDVRRALGLEYKKARGSKKAVRIAGGSDVETSQKTRDPPPRPAKIKKRRQTIAFRATEPSPSPERMIPIRSAGKRRGSAVIRGSTSDGESGGRKSKKVKFPESSKDGEKDDATWTPSRPMARSKRVASEMLYYWSSSSDDEFGRINNSRDDDDELSQEGGEVLQQHGWIVGDSHKKLVTLLAHAKGKKTEECSVKETSSGNNKKKSSS